MSTELALDATQMCIIVRTPGSTSRQPAGTTTIARSKEHLGTIGPTARTERGAEALCFAELVVDDLIFAPHETEVVELVEQVGRMRSTPGAATA